MVRKAEQFLKKKSKPKVLWNFSDLHMIHNGREGSEGKDFLLKRV